MDRVPPGRWTVPVLRNLVLLAATLTTGLVAGLFAAFSYAVMPGLGRTGDATFVVAMQRINVAIINGWFGLCFGGALVSGALAAVLLRGSPAGWWALAGVLSYAAVLVVTFALSVPLNDALAAAGDTGPAAARAAFETSWVRWNVVRTVLSTGAFGALAWALLLHGRATG
jgi:uncharacterized membrane protein